MKLNSIQRKWSSYDKELFASNSDIKKIRYMLGGRYFHIFTDQNPLIYAF